MTYAAANPIARLRRAAASLRVRAALAAFAIVLLGTQLFLQSHLASHRLALKASDVCEFCLAAEHAAPVPVAAAAFAPTFVIADAPIAVPTLALPAPVPLVVRSRGPPAFATLV